MPAYDVLLNELRTQIPELEAPALADTRGALVIDIRESDEVAQGMIPDTTWIPRGHLESRIGRAAPELSAPIVLVCASGNRSLLGARSLRELGYTNVKSLAGGFTGWKRAGLPWAAPATLRADQEARYSRHVMLPEVGIAGQLKLLASKVVCIGAGGLGSPSSMYLAAAGIGTLGMIDDDVVDASNLQRQILHGTDRVGKPKVDSAEQTIKNLNPDVKVVKHRTRITAANAIELLSQYDVIVDGADNFATRYLVNDVALRIGKPVVHASIFRFEGQLTTFLGTGAPCYRCIFPQPPAPGEAPSCSEAGVIGVLPGTLGALQAMEVIKLVLGIGEPLSGRLVSYDALRARFRELQIKRDPKCPTCGDGVDRKTIPLIDYEEFCSRPA